MSSAPWSHPLRAARPFGLLSRTRSQLPFTRSSRILPLRYGHQPGVRSFHFAPTAVAVVQATQDAIINLHSITHIPWFLMIPCVAIGINVVFRLPFNVYTQRITQRRSKLGLVLRGWSWRLQRDVSKEGVPVDRHEKEVLKRYKKVLSRVHRNTGSQGWKLYSSILGFPFWLIGIESVRRICGSPRGILGSLITGRGEETAAILSTPEDVEAATTPADISTMATSQVPTIDPSTASIVAEHTRHLPDPSIAVEGCLWFPDLSAADPYHILPLALSVVMVANILPKTKAGLQQLAGLESKEKSIIQTPAMRRQLRLRRGLILLASMIGPITADLPAALHLYWLASSTTHWVTSKVLSHFMPLEAKVVERYKGAEVNVIRPKRIEKSSPQNEQNRTKK
ncbi:hypothetical protein F4776DRAFT_134508 [Hypoxylon sp. NC0597]|nr:hypothetical protein F4776DRAFT_134508 [Hypoxylon sp. NC0597]